MCGTPSTTVPCDDESWRKSVEGAKCTWIIGSHTSKPKRRCARGSRWRLRQSLVNHARVDPRHLNSRACFRASLAGSATGAHGHTMNRPARDKGIEEKGGEITTKIHICYNKWTKWLWYAPYLLYLDEGAHFLNHVAPGFLGADGAHGEQGQQLAVAHREPDSSTGGTRLSDGENVGQVIYVLMDKISERCIVQCIT